MANTLRWVPQLAEGDVVREPFSDVPVAMIDPYDIGAVAASAMTSAEHSGQVYTLSGPELIRPADRVQILGEVLGRPLALNPLSNDEARAVLRRAAAGRIRRRDVQLLCRRHDRRLPRAPDRP